MVGPVYVQPTQAYSGTCPGLVEVEDPGCVVASQVGYCHSDLSTWNENVCCAQAQVRAGPYQSIVSELVGHISGERVPDDEVASWRNRLDHDPGSDLEQATEQAGRADRCLISVKKHRDSGAGRDGGRYGTGSQLPGQPEPVGYLRNSLNAQPDQLRGSVVTHR